MWSWSDPGCGPEHGTHCIIYDIQALLENVNATLLCSKLSNRILKFLYKPIQVNSQNTVQTSFWVCKLSHKSSSWWICDMCSLFGDMLLQAGLVPGLLIWRGVGLWLFSIGPCKEGEVWPPPAPSILVHAWLLLSGSCYADKLCLHTSAARLILGECFPGIENTAWVSLNVYFLSQTLIYASLTACWVETSN
jgi:hypothetical protein